MSKRFHIPSWGYKLLLLVAAAVWGLGTVVLKDTVNALPPFWLVGIRFLFAGIILSAIFARRIARNLTTETLIASIFLGALLGLAYGANTSGLLYTTASKSTVITAMQCVVVPFLAWAISRTRPTLFNLIAAGMGIVGIAFVSLDGTEGFTLGLGEAITLLSALLFAIQVAFMAKLGDGRDAVVMTAVQFLVGGIACLAVGVCFEPLPDFTVLADPEVARNIAYIIVFASVLALTLENVGLAHVAAGPASLILATESVFGVGFAILLLGEALTRNILAGFVLVTLAIVLNETIPMIRRKRHVVMHLGNEGALR
ncbi:DMT family transporter [Slackia exigua]|uniref:DMT family transporter n=1 Tax=Slackia exigua TaxID=84109 RepID=UPI0028D252CA|nr:DMT family transporter [Slackia exigua]